MRSITPPQTPYIWCIMHSMILVPLVVQAQDSTVVHSLYVTPDFREFRTLAPLLVMIFTIPFYCFTLLLLFRRRKHFPIAGRGARYLIGLNVVFLLSGIIQGIVGIAYPHGIPCGIHFLMEMIFTVPICIFYMIRAWILVFRIEIMNFLSESRWRDERRALKEKYHAEHGTEEEEAMEKGESPSKKPQDESVEKKSFLALSDADNASPDSIDGHFFIIHRNWTELRFIRRFVAAAVVCIIIGMIIIAIFDPDVILTDQNLHQHGLLPEDESTGSQYSPENFTSAPPCMGYAIKPFMFNFCLSLFAVPLATWSVWRMVVDMKRQKARSAEQERMHRYVFGEEVAARMTKAAEKQNPASMGLDDSTNVKMEMFIIINCAVQGVGIYYPLQIFATGWSNLLEPVVFFIAAVVSLAMPLKLSYAISRKHRELMDNARARNSTSTTPTNSPTHARRGSAFDLHGALPHQRPYYSLKYIIRNQHTYPVLLQFLTKEFSSENALFWTEVREFEHACRELEAQLPHWPNALGGDADDTVTTAGGDAAGAKRVSANGRGKLPFGAKPRNNNVHTFSQSPSVVARPEPAHNPIEIAARSEQQQSTEEEQENQAPPKSNLLIQATLPGGDEIQLTNFTAPNSPLPVHTTAQPVAAAVVVIAPTATHPNTSTDVLPPPISAPAPLLPRAGSVPFFLPSLPNSAKQSWSAKVAPLPPPPPPLMSRMASPDISMSHAGEETLIQLNSGSTFMRSPPESMMKSSAAMHSNSASIDFSANQQDPHQLISLHRQSFKLREWALSISSKYLDRSAMYEINIPEDLSKLVASQIKQLQSWHPSPEDLKCAIQEQNNEQALQIAARHHHLPSAPPFALSTLYKQTQLSVFELIQTDSFRRFVLTPAFQQLLKQADEDELQRIEKQADLTIATAAVIDQALNKLSSGGGSVHGSPEFVSANAISSSSAQRGSKMTSPPPLPVRMNTTSNDDTSTVGKHAIVSGVASLLRTPNRSPRLRPQTYASLNLRVQVAAIAANNAAVATTGATGTGTSDPHTPHSRSQSRSVANHKAHGAEVAGGSASSSAPGTPHLTAAQPSLGSPARTYAIASSSPHQSPVHTSRQSRRNNLVGGVELDLVRTERSRTLLPPDAM